MDNKTIQINEAIMAGHDVLAKCDEILEYLSSAKLWGIFDMVSNNSMIMSFIKHSKVDKAQKSLDDLRYSLNIFNSELDDVKIYSDVKQISFDNLLKLCDIFLDNFFVDFYALSKIANSKNEVEKLKSEVKNVVNQLECIY